MQCAVCTVFGLVFLLSVPVAAQSIIVEAEGETLAYCEYFHVPLTCEERHKTNEPLPTVGGILELDGESYFVEWMGPAYHMDTGVILQPTGVIKRGLKGQRWLEVYPNQGKIHTMRAWKDADGNRALSVSDTLALDSGSIVMVKDVRLELRVRPVPPEP